MENNTAMVCCLCFCKEKSGVEGIERKIFRRQKTTPNNKIFVPGTQIFPKKGSLRVFCRIAANHFAFLRVHSMVQYSHEMKRRCRRGMLHTYLAKCERETQPRALRILKMELREMHGEDGTPFFICYELLFSHPGAYSIYLSKIKAGKTE